MSTGTTAEAVIGVLLRRAEIIEYLLEGATEKRDLVDALDGSRSTVDRGLQDLEELDLIEPRPDGVAPTLTAHLVVTAYNAFDEHIAASAAQTAGDEPVWNTDEERQEALRLVTERLDFLECVASTPLDKRDLVDALDYSRATVDRAIRDLEVAGLVQWTPDGYTTTAIGQQTAEQYHTTIETVTAILASQDLLQVLPAQCAITPALVAGADTERADETTPYRLPAGIRERIETADRLRILLPVLAAPQLLDLCHRRVVQDGTAVELVTDTALFDTLTTELAGPLSEMATDSAFTAIVADAPPFGLVLADTDAGTTVSVIAHIDRRSVYGAIHNDTAAAVRWAEERYNHSRVDATERTADLQDLTPTEPGSVRLSGVTDPEHVIREAEGFVQLSADYFAQRTPAPPATGWRTGFDLIDVHAGYAIDRADDSDGGRSNLTDDLIDRLSEGTDHAVLGPPGSGKSTVCKAVACQWYEQGKGAVFYRESGTGATFSSHAILSAHLRAAAAEGHALVVVEDAVRAEANAVFRLMTAFRGNRNVTFLLDAREDQWHDPVAFPTDARLDAYRTEAVETVTMPTLDEPEAERFIHQFEDLTGHEVDVTAAQLLQGTGTEDTDVEEQETGQAADHPDELLVLLHRLALYTDPLAGYDTKTPTTLVEDVQRAYENLHDAGDLVLDVGVLVNLLNAAGIGVYPALVYALADDGFDDVRAALSSLEGRLIFERDGDTDAVPYRTVHEEWSGLFLDYLLDAEGYREACRRFGRCVTALLALADDPVLRERIASEFGDDAPVIDRIATTPGEWADTTVERVFQLGLARPGLAPLFGTTDDPSIEFPDACSADLEPRCAEWRGRMYFLSGHRDRAKRELGRVEDLVDHGDAVSPDQGAELKARSHKYLGGNDYKRGEFDTAEEFYIQALDSYRAINDRLGVANCLNNIGAIAHERSNFDRAEEHYEQSLDSYCEIGAPRKKQANTLNNLGWTAALRGNLDRAEEYLEQSLDIGRKLDGHPGMVNTFLNLGEVTRWRTKLDRAEEYHKQGLDLARSSGQRPGEARGLLGLGTVASDRSDFDRAEEYLERSLSIGREVGDKWGRAVGHRHLGKIRRRQEEFDVAEYHLTEALMLCREIGDRREEGKTLVELGELARSRDDLEPARAQFEDAIGLYRDIGAMRDAIDALMRLSEVCETEDDLDAAIGHCETAQQLVREADFELGEKRPMLDERHEQLVTQPEHPD